MSLFNALCKWLYISSYRQDRQTISTAAFCLWIQGTSILWVDTCFILPEIWTHEGGPRFRLSVKGQGSEYHYWKARGRKHRFGFRTWCFYLVYKLRYRYFQFGRPPSCVPTSGNMGQCSTKNIIVPWSHKQGQLLKLCVYLFYNLRYSPLH